MNVESLTNIFYLGFHEGRTSAIDHNLVYQANYIGLGSLSCNMRAGRILKKWDTLISSQVQTFECFLIKIIQFLFYIFFSATQRSVNPYNMK